MYTKRPNFNNFGRFFMSKKQENPCTPKKLKKPGDEPGFNIVPRAMQGAFATMWCKGTKFIPNPCAWMQATCATMPILAFCTA